MRRGERDALRRGRPGARTLIARKYEQPVFPDGPPARSAELVTAQGILRRCEKIARVEVAVPDELEEVAADLIGAGLGDDVDHRAGVQSVTRGYPVRLHAELLQRVRKGEGQIDVGMRIVVVAAVQQVIIAVDLTT